MRILFLFALGVLVTACTKAEYRAEEDPNVQKIGSWIVVCAGGKINTVGQVTVRKHCRIEVAGDVWDTKMNVEPIVRIDSTGVYIVDGTLVWESPCRWKPKHSGVDSVPIDGLPVKQQIRAMREGKIFARETQAVWPYCWKEIEEAPLDRFGEAYDLMMMRWTTFRDAT